MGDSIRCEGCDTGLSERPARLAAARRKFREYDALLCGSCRDEADAKNARASAEEAIGQLREQVELLSRSLKDSHAERDSLRTEVERLRAVVEAKTFKGFWEAVEQAFPMARHNAELRDDIDRLRAITAACPFCRDATKEDNRV